jgi:hypothetical protein
VRVLLVADLQCVECNIYEAGDFERHLVFCFILAYHYVDVGGGVAIEWLLDLGRSVMAMHLHVRQVR